MKPTLQVRSVTDGSVQAAKAFRRLERVRVYVGVPEANAQRKGQSDVTNPQLVFLHTLGVRSSSARRQVGAAMLNRRIGFDAATELYLRSHGSMAFAIPPRPIIEPAIEAPDNKRVIVDELKQAGAAVLDGKDGEGRTHFKRAGMEAQNRVRAWFTDPRNHWAPNAPATIRRKGSDKPLIDTDEMRKSIIYVLSEGK